MTLSQRTTLYLGFALFVVGLLWGVYSLIVYLGVPLHHLVYARPEEASAINAACGNSMDVGVLLCRGSAVIFPFIIAIFETGSPLMTYTIISVLLYAAVLIIAGLRTGRFRAKFSVRPLVLIGFFAASLWLIGTTLSVGSLNNLHTPENIRVTEPNGQTILPPFRRFYEPTPQVYGGLGQQALNELQANYKDLLDRGCLQEYAMTQSGARVYNMRFWCMQGSMFARVGGQLLMVLLFLLNLLVVGRFLLRSVLRLKNQPLLLELAFAVGVGALTWVAVLWGLSVMGMLRMLIVRALFFGLPLVLFPHTWAWCKAAWNEKVDADISLTSVHTLLVWLLISYLALNFLNVVRPFPIGWDDLGSYLNRPRLLASYGSFIPSMSQFQWEYLSSLGYVLFGLDSIFGSTFAMQINWSAGLLAVISVYVFGRMFFGQRGGVLAAILYYFLPMTGHFSFADMKIDNASFFTSALAVLALCVYLFGTPGTTEDEEPNSRGEWQLLVIAGLLGGFSFAIKPTAILVVIMMLSIFSGARFGAWAFAGMSLFGLFILQKFGPLSISQIGERLGIAVSTTSNTTWMFVWLILGAGLSVMAWYRNKITIDALQKFGKSLAWFMLGFLVAIGPWAAYNLVTAQTPSLSVMLKAEDNTAPQVFYTQRENTPQQVAPTTPVRYLPEELKLNPDDPACKTSARVEELDRYWGFERGLTHYLTLPWRQVMNIDAYGYYVTLSPVLLLVPLILLLPTFWDEKRRWLRLLFAGSMVFLVEWMFVANGIMWYGIGMFLCFALILEALVRYAPDTANRALYSTLVTFGILVCLMNRFWQFDTQKNIFEYPLGKVSATALREVTIPDYDDIRDSVVARHEQMKDRPYTYRIGTFISYFIPKNREILPLADHQLGFFNCLNQERDHALTLRRLQALGFNSMIFDTNTQTIEKDPNGSLHQKVNAFLAFVNDQKLNLRLEVNDPGNGIAYILLP